MGNAFHRHDYHLQDDEIRAVKKETGFNESQVKRLFRRFHHLDKEGKGYLVKEDLLHIKEIILNPIGTRLVDLLFNHQREKLYFRDFANSFSVFRPIKPRTMSYAVNSRESKLKFLFQLLDINETDSFNREDIFELLEMMMGSKVDEEQLHQIADRMISEADLNQDGTVNLSEFRKVTIELDIEGAMSFLSFRS